MFPGPISVWLVVQLAALSLAAFRIPLAAHYPQPGESHAVVLLLIAQFGSVSLLFPWMLSSAAMVIAALAAGWLMLVGAAALAAWDWTGVILLGTYLSAWVIALGFIRFTLNATQQLVGSAIASLYIVGGSILAYFQQEFAGTQGVSQGGWVFGPMFQAISTPHHLPPSAWGEPVFLVLVAGSLGFWLKNRHPPAPLSSTARP